MLTLAFAATIFALLCFCVWLVCPYEWQSFKVANTFNKMPGPKAFPIIGNSLHLNASPPEFINVIANDFKKYGSLFRIWFFGKLYVFTCNPDIAEILFKSRTELDKSDSYYFFQNMFGQSLGSCAGSLWHARRKMLDPAFHADNLRDYVQVFNRESAILVDNLTSLGGDDYIDIHKWVALCTLDILSATVMDVQLGAQTGRHAEFVEAINRVCVVIMRRAFAPWLFHPLSFKLSSLGREEAKVLDIIHKCAEKVIKEKMEADSNPSSVEESQYSDTPKKRPNVLELLLKNYSSEKGGLSAKCIANEVTQFMFVGHDTSAVSLCWALMLLGSHPEIQARAVEELKGIFGDSDRQADVKDLNDMKYMERVIKESLRLYPGVPILARKLQEDIQVDGFTIPAGTNVNVMTYFLHRDPRYFPDPDKFVPDRFLPERMQGWHPYCYLAFSMGIRNCIGLRFAMMEQKIILSSILRKFQVTSLGTIENIQGTIQLVMRPVPEQRIKFTPRLKASP